MTEEASPSALAKQMAETSTLQEGGMDDVDDPDISLKAPGFVEVDADADLEGVTDLNSNAAADIYKAAETFEELGLSPDLIKGLYQEMKVERPSKIQAKTLPVILRHPFPSMIAQSHNGSGKTTCFTLAMLSRVDPALEKPQALCVCPTRELVIQNLRVLEKMATHTKIRAISTTETGKMSRDKITAQVVIGAHGGLKKRVRYSLLDTEDIRILVFDEADEMLAQDGFGDDSVRLLRDIQRKSKHVQLLLFSATFEDRVRDFAQKVAPNAVTYFIPAKKLSLDVIKQLRVRCPGDDGKIKFLKDAFSLAQNLCQTVVFVKYKASAHKLARGLKDDGFSVSNLTGDLEPEQRDQVVQEFRDGKTKVLIATDVLSRGFDLETISLVINYHIPTDKRGVHVDFSKYLHRIGRSGRFGRKGCAFNLYDNDREKELLDQIERHFNHPIPDMEYDNEDKLEKVLQDAGI